MHSRLQHCIETRGSPTLLSLYSCGKSHRHLSVRTLHGLQTYEGRGRALSYLSRLSLQRTELLWIMFIDAMSRTSSKIKSILVLKLHAMKVYAGVEVEIYAFLTLTLDTFSPRSPRRSEHRDEEKSK
jgi:hypothetical protein